LEIFFPDSGDNWLGPKLSRCAKLPRRLSAKALLLQQWHGVSAGLQLAGDWPTELPIAAHRVLLAMLAQSGQASQRGRIGLRLASREVGGGGPVRPQHGGSHEQSNFAPAKLR
jgi:hypothetical protein